GAEAAHLAPSETASPRRACWSPIRSSSHGHLDALPVDSLELTAALVALARLGLGRPLDTKRRRRRVLVLLHRDEAEDRVHQLDVAFALAQSLDRGAVLEQHVDGATLLRDRIRELAHAPLEHLTDGRTLILEQRSDPCG